MAGMLEKVFKKAGPKDKDKPRNLLKRIGIFSGLIWLAGMGVGAVFAIKDFGLSPADTHAKPEKDADGKTELADVPSHADAGGEAESNEGSTPQGEPQGETHGETNVKGHDQGHHETSPAEGSHGGIGTDGNHHGNHPVKSDEGHSVEAEAVSEEASGEQGGEVAAHGEIEAEAGGVGPANQDERDALRQLAEIHVSHGDLEKAVRPLRKLMMAPTRDVTLLSMATEVFLGTGNYQEALNAARKAIRHSPPGRVDLQVAAIMSEYRLGKVSEALKEAEEAVKAHPKDLDLLTALGTMEIEMGPAHPRYGVSLEKARRLKPDHIPTLYQIARKSQLEGDYKDAEIQFRKVLKRDPKHAKAHGQLGTALYHLQKNSEARKEFETALAANPKDYNTWFNLGELHLAVAAKEGSPVRIRALRAEAMTCYLKAVEWNPDHAEAHYRAGVILNGNGQFKEAIRHLEAARKNDSRHVATLIQLAVAYENLKKPERAKTYLEKALELDPTDKIVLSKLKRST